MGWIISNWAIGFVWGSVFDKLGEGWIMSTDLRDVMKHLGERLSDPEVDDMLKEADRENKGRVFYQGTALLASRSSPFTSPNQLI